MKSETIKEYIMLDELFDLAEILKGLPFRNHNLPVHFHNALYAGDYDTMQYSLRDVCNELRDMKFFTQEDVDTAVEEACESVRDDEVSPLESEVEELTEARDELETKVEDLQDRLDSTESDREAYELTAVRLEKEVAALQRELELCEKELADAKCGPLD
jgi:predicted ribosome quality control (RQC) complex YloA/Tae2 family protein